MYFICACTYIATQLQFYSILDHMQYTMLGGYYLLASYLSPDFY